MYTAGLCVCISLKLNLKLFTSKVYIFLVQKKNRSRRVQRFTRNSSIFELPVSTDVVEVRFFLSSLKVFPCCFHRSFELITCARSPTVREGIRSWVRTTNTGVTQLTTSVSFSCSFPESKLLYLIQLLFSTVTYSEAFREQEVKTKETQISRTFQLIEINEYNITKIIISSIKRGISCIHLKFMPLNIQIK